MAHPDIKLILSDIDGTILPHSERVVSQEVLEAFHAAEAAGIRIGPASGRAISHVAPAFGDNEAYVATCLATNGMQVYLDGKLIHEEYLEREALKRTKEVVSNIEGAGLICFDGGTPLLVCGTVEGLAAAFPLYAKTVRPHEGIPEWPIVKANVFVEGGLKETEAVLQKLINKVPELGFNLPIPNFINLTPFGYSKASGIDILCEALGINIEQVVVFGDSGNDLEMLEHVPNSVAVSNATEAACKAAHWHIGSCEEGAVAKAIQQLASGSWPFRK